MYRTLQSLWICTILNYIIPVHNEALNLPTLIRDIFFYDPEARICVLNSASTDEGIELVRKYPVVVIDTPKGYTQALAKGYQYAKVSSWDTLIQLDGDGQHHPMYALALHKQLAYADWVVASRHRTGSYAPRGVRYASWIGCRYLLNGQLQDPSSGYWALSAKAIHRFAESFPIPFTEIPLRAAEGKHLKIVEVPIPMSERKEGISMNSGWKGILHGLKMLHAGWKSKEK